MKPNEPHMIRGHMTVSTNTGLDLTHGRGGMEVNRVLKKGSLE